MADAVPSAGPGAGRARQVGLSRLLLLVAVAGVTYLATTPIVFPVVATVNDKLEHVAAFAVLALLTDLSFPEAAFGWEKVTALTAYALAIEAVQWFLPYRSSEWLDVAAGVSGVALYVVTWPLLRRVPWLAWRWRALER